MIDELELFAGAGGGILGGILVGHRCVGAVEIDDYARSVLLARQRDGCLPWFPIWDDIRTFRADNPACAEYFAWLRSRRRQLVIKGGFPCQDISAAGKGEGIDGERSGLWREMARVVREIRPAYVFVENSPLLVGRGLAVVLGELAEMGYDAVWGIVGAHHAGAPHERERIWILAWSNEAMGCGSTGIRRDGVDGAEHAWAGALADAGGGRCGEPRSGEGEQPRRTETERTGEAISNPDRSGRQELDLASESEGPGQHSRFAGAGDVSDAAGDRGDGWGLSERPGGSDQTETDLERVREIVPDSARILEGWQEQRAEWERTGEGGEPVIQHAACIGLYADKEERDALHVAAGGGGQGHAGRADFERRERWQPEPDVGRVAHGVASRVDRLKCIGNGQVPDVVRLAWEVLTESAPFEKVEGGA